MPKYNHAFDVAFEVISENPNGATEAEILAGLKKRLKNLEEKPHIIPEAIGSPYDTYEIQEKE